MHMLCEEKTVRELFEGLEDGFIYSLFLAGVGMPNEGLTITAMEELIFRKKDTLVVGALEGFLKGGMISDSLKYAISETLIEIAEKESDVYKLGNRLLTELAEPTQH